MTLEDAYNIHEDCLKKQTASKLLSEKQRILMESFHFIQSILNIEQEIILRAALLSKDDLP